MGIVNQDNITAGCCVSDRGAGVSGSGGVPTLGGRDTFSLQVAEAIRGTGGEDAGYGS
jgi:hypothetical protein